ncbi:hypothetical protein M413DRAFT_11004 [Hebeloma cylindrosporum]|uniref:Uncharacterized protein n=1 Tax=Hebeloma cylindrosporum TaxID=76867 RepID=A0A0C2XUR9_HEBCY|nr:hypothetical protein M413DRAFT_11004 [Hebeloma cylindrosporum h7]
MADFHSRLSIPSRLLDPQLALWLNNNAPLPNNDSDKAKKLRTALIDKSELNSSHGVETQLAISQLTLILSPIRGVPQDIWNEIFSLCVPESPRPGLSLSVAPLSLTRVCRAWQSMAINNPYLWNKMHVSIPTYRRKVPKTPSGEALKEIGEMLHVWLDRSGEVPLSIALDLPDGHEVSNSSSISQFIHRVELCSSRIYSLELSLSRSPGLYNRFTALDPLPNLREITVDKVPVNIMRRTKEIPWTDAGIFHVSQLRKVTIGDLPRRDYRTASWFIPSNWSNLQYFHIGTPIPELRILEIFALLHRLIECSMVIAGRSDDVFGVYNHEPPIRSTLLNLKSLALSDSTDSAWNLAPLFGHLDISGLTTLKLKLMKWAVRDTFGNPMLALLPRISALNKLDLELEKSCYAAWTLDVFRVTPFLRHLVLHLPRSDFHLWEKHGGYTESHKTLLDLTSPRLDLLLVDPLANKRVIILPKLEILEFRGDMDVQCDQFRDIILQRLDPASWDIATLKHISASFNETIADEITGQIGRHNEKVGIECFLDFSVYPDPWRRQEHVVPRSLRWTNQIPGARDGIPESRYTTIALRHTLFEEL